MDTDSLVITFAKIGFVILVGISLVAFLYRLVTDALQVHVTRTRYSEVQHRFAKKGFEVTIHPREPVIAGGVGAQKLTTQASFALGQPQAAPHWLLELY